MVPLQILSFVIFVSAWSFSVAVDEDETDIGALMHFFPLQFKESFFCPAIYGRYPHERDCSMFYECRYGYPHLMKCARGKLYDQKREQCNDQRRVKCDRYEKDHNKDRDRDHEHKELEKDEQSKIYQCPYIWGTFAHPNDCSKYFVCVYNIPTLFQCYGSNLYDDRSRKCLDKRRVNCGKRLDKDQLKTSRRPNVRTTSIRPRDRTTEIPTTKEELKTSRRPNVRTTSIRPRYTTTEIPTTEEDSRKFRCPFPHGRYADPLDCSQFYECRSIVPTLYKCPKSTLYDERKEECLKDKYVRCGDRPGGVGEDDGKNKDKKKELRCPYLWGIFPHPEDCSKYLICIYNVPTVFSCGKYDLFHAFYRRCFPKDHVTCDHGINPDDPSPQTPKPRPTTILVSTTTPATTASPTTTTIAVSTVKQTTTTPVLTTTSTTNRPTTTPVSTTIATSPITTTLATTTRPTSTTPVSTTIATSPITTTLATTTNRPRTTPVSTTIATSPITTTLATTTRPTTTTPVSTTIATSPITTTFATTTPVSTSIPTTPRPITSTISTTLRQTSTASTSRPSTTVIPTTKISTTPQSTTKVPKPNTPPPTDCEEGDLDCIIDGTGDVIGWFDCPERYGHFAHGSSQQLFIHCDNWHPFVKKCADDTVFSPKYLVCTWLDQHGQMSKY